MINGKAGFLQRDTGMPRSHRLLSAEGFILHGAGLYLWGPSVQRRKRSPLEDPVKNAACSRNVRPRRGL